MNETKIRSIMRRVLCAFFACTLVVSACFVGMPASSAAGTLTDAKVQGFEDQIAKLQEEQKRIRSNLNKLQRESASMQQYKAELDSYLDTVSRQMAAARTLIDELDAKIAEKNDEITKNTAEHDAMYQKFLDIMVLTHEEGEASYIGLILGADSLGDFLSRLERVSSMMDYNKTVMEKLRSTGTQLETDKAALLEAVALQEATIESLKESEADYQAKCDEVIAQIAALGKNQAAAQAELAKNQKLEDELDKVELTTGSAMVGADRLGNGKSPGRVGLFSF